MNKDIRVSVTLPTHPKSIKLMRRLGDRSFYCLIRLWAFVAQNKPDGNLAGMDIDDIEIAADWQGEYGKLVDELCTLKLLDEGDDGYVVHDWSDHNEYASHATARSEKAKQAAAKRWQTKNGEMPNVKSSSAGSKPEQCRTDAGSNAQSCPEHCQGDADSNAKNNSGIDTGKTEEKTGFEMGNNNKVLMLNHARSIAKPCSEQCPSPYPYPYPNELKDKSPPQVAGQKTASRASPPLVTSSEKKTTHFRQHVGDVLSELVSACKQLDKKRDKHGKELNAYKLLQWAVNEEYHPGAILEVFREMINNWELVESAWGFFRSVGRTRSRNYYEKENMWKAEHYRETIDDLAKQDIFKALGLEIKNMPKLNSG